MTVLWLIAWFLFGMQKPQMFVIVWNVWSITLAAAVVFDAGWLRSWWHEGRHPLGSLSRVFTSLRFLGHFTEMAIVMVLGMVVLSLAARAMQARGVDFLSQPEPWLFAMSLAMAIPMVVWMRIRGHGWEPSAEMAAAMVVPAVACIGLCVVGPLSPMTMLGLGHALMWVAMLGLMLWRWTGLNAFHVPGPSYVWVALGSLAFGFFGAGLVEEPGWPVG